MCGRLSSQEIASRYETITVLQTEDREERREKWKDAGWEVRGVARESSDGETERTLACQAPVTLEILLH